MSKPGFYSTITLTDIGTIVRDLSDNCMSMGDLAIAYDELEANGYGPNVKQFCKGLADIPLELEFDYDKTPATGNHAVLYALAASQTITTTVVIEIGSGAAPTAGDARLTGVFQVFVYNVNPDKNGKVTSTASLKVADGAALPAWTLIP